MRNQKKKTKLIQLETPVCRCKECGREIPEGKGVWVFKRSEGQKVSYHLCHKCYGKI